MAETAAAQFGAGAETRNRVYGYQSFHKLGLFRPFGVYYREQSFRKGLT